jgi:hypothetical protein
MLKMLAIGLNLYMNLMTSALQPFVILSQPFANVRLAFCKAVQVAAGKTPEPIHFVLPGYLSAEILGSV